MTDESRISKRLENDTRDIFLPEDVGVIQPIERCGQIPGSTPWSSSLRCASDDPIGRAA